MSGIPSEAVPFCGTTKNLHSIFVFKNLHSIFVFNFYVASSSLVYMCFDVYMENNAFYLCVLLIVPLFQGLGVGIKLPWLPTSVLFSFLFFFCYWQLLVSSLAMIANLIQLKLSDFIFTASMYLSFCHMYCVSFLFHLAAFHVLVLPLHCLLSLSCSSLTNSFEVVQFAMATACFAFCWCVIPL